MYEGMPLRGMNAERRMQNALWRVRLREQSVCTPPLQVASPKNRRGSVASNRQKIKSDVKGEKYEH